MGHSRERGYAFKVAILWLSILIVGSFYLTARSAQDSVSLAVVPEVPREGGPVVATFKLNNPSARPLVTSYQFYANAALVGEGVATIPPASSQAFQYVYRNPLRLGEQLSFALRTHSELGDIGKTVASPPYPPQVWSSFVSFAAMSSTMMSSMSSMAYYKNDFNAGQNPNIGLLISLVLIALLVFLELSQPVLQRTTAGFLARLRLKLSTVTWILFVIFVGVVYTKVVLILAG